MSSTSDLTSPAGGFASVHFAESAPGISALEAAGIRVAEIDGAAVMDRDDLMKAFEVAFELPDYFGRNWDAFHEVICDLDWLDASGHVLVVIGAEIFWRRHPEMAGKLVSIWASSADEVWSSAPNKWEQVPIPFHLVFVR